MRLTRWIALTALAALIGAHGRAESPRNCFLRALADRTLTAPADLAPILKRMRDLTGERLPLADEELEAALTSSREKLRELVAKRASLREPDEAKRLAEETHALLDPLRWLYFRRELTDAQATQLQEGMRTILNQVVLQVAEILSAREMPHQLMMIGNNRILRLHAPRSPGEARDTLGRFLARVLDPDAVALAAKGRFHLSSIVFPPAPLDGASFRSFDRSIAIDLMSLLEARPSHALLHELRHAQTDLLARTGKPTPANLELSAKAGTTLPGEIGTEQIYGDYLALDELLTYRADLQGGAGALASGLSQGNWKGPAGRAAQSARLLAIVAERSRRSLLVLERALRGTRRIRSTAHDISLRDPKTGATIDLPLAALPERLRARISELRAGLEESAEATRARVTEEKSANRIRSLELEPERSALRGEIEELRRRRDSLGVVHSEASRRARELGNAAREAERKMELLRRRLSWRTTREEEGDAIRLELLALEPRRVEANRLAEESALQVRALQAERESLYSDLTHLSGKEAAISNELLGLSIRGANLSRELFAANLAATCPEHELSAEESAELARLLIRWIRDARRMADDRAALARAADQALGLMARARSRAQQIRLAWALSLISRKRGESGALTPEALMKELRGIAYPRR